MGVYRLGFAPPPPSIESPPQTERTIKTVCAAPSTQLCRCLILRRTEKRLLKACSSPICGDSTATNKKGSKVHDDILYFSASHIVIMCATVKGPTKISIFFALYLSHRTAIQTICQSKGKYIFARAHPWHVHANFPPVKQQRKIRPLGNTRIPRRMVAARELNNSFRTFPMWERVGRSLPLRRPSDDGGRESGPPRAPPEEKRSLRKMLASL